MKLSIQSYTVINSSHVVVAKLVPGCYAIKVEGELDETIEQELEENNFPNLGKLSQQD